MAPRTDLWIAFAVIAGLVVGVLGGAGCRSPATHFYTLVPPGTGSAGAAGAAGVAGAALQIEVLPVDVPADVDRAELVVRKSRGEVTAVDGRAWIAPLPQEIQRALAGALVRELHARDVTDGTPDAALPVIRVKLVVRRFESTLADGALIDAAWTVRVAKPDAAPATCDARVAEPAAKHDYETLVEAHQRALGALAADIASTVRAVAAGEPAGGDAACARTVDARRDGQ